MYVCMNIGFRVWGGPPPILVIIARILLVYHRVGGFQLMYQETGYPPALNAQMSNMSNALRFAHTHKQKQKSHIPKCCAEALVLAVQGDTQDVVGINHGQALKNPQACGLGGASAWA